MVELRDIIDLIIMDNNDPIYIFDDNNEMFEYGVDDISDILSHYIDTITIYDGRVEICLYVESWVTRFRLERKVSKWSM